MAPLLKSCYYTLNIARAAIWSTVLRTRVKERGDGQGRWQRFLSVFEPLNAHFSLPLHLLRVSDYRQKMGKRFKAWREMTEPAATV